MNKVILFFSFSISILSFSQNDICPIKIGEEIPNSNLLNMDGDTLSISNIVANKKTVIVFFRGGWCPYYTKHLKAIGEVMPKLDSLGYKLIAITVDNVSKMSVLDSEEELEYGLFSDINGEAIDNFGISFQFPAEKIKKYKEAYGLDLKEKSVGGHTKIPVPAVFIINENKVVYEYVNPDYHNRLSTDVLLAMLKH